MNLHDIEEALRRFDRDIDEIVEAYDERSTGYESVVEEKYRAIKEELESERHQIDTKLGMRSATEGALTYYYPAVDDAWLELSTKSGSAASPKMIGELRSAGDKLKYRLLELSKREAE